MIRNDLLHPPGRLSIADAAGLTRSCPLVLTRHAVRKYPGAPSPEYARRAIRQLWRAIALPWMISTALYLAAFAVVLWWSVSWPPSDPVTVGGLSVAIMAIYLTIGSTPTMIAYRRAHMAYFAATAHCAWCLYDLRSVPANIHDLTTCPECGGRWRLPTPSPEA